MTAGAVLLLIIIGSVTKPSAPIAATPIPALDATTSNVAPTPLVAPPTAEQATAPTAEQARQWTMPDLVGQNLQDAQDAIQARTGNAVFFTRSHDATGAGRHQILDRDWKVCTQNVGPGTTITPDTMIDFGAAKLHERC